MQEYLTASSEASKYVIADGVMPIREPHLLGGPSGGSKTTIALTMLDAISRGLPILGLATTKMRCGYIAADRSLESVRETLQRIGLNLDGIPILSLVDSPSIADLNLAIERLGVRSGFVVVDAVAAYVKGGKINDYATVAEFLRSLTRICKASDITILGTTHSSKMRTDTRYDNTREQLIGSAAWAAFSGTVMVTEPVNPKDVCDRRRRFSLMPRNARARCYELTVDDHGRIPGLTAKGEEYLDFRLSQLVTGSEVSTETLLQWGREGGMSERGAQRWIQSAAAKTGGKLTKVGFGLYTVSMRAFSLEDEAFHGPERRG